MMSFNTSYKSKPITATSTSSNNSFINSLRSNNKVSNEDNSDNKANNGNGTKISNSLNEKIKRFSSSSTTSADSSIASTTTADKPKSQRFSSISKNNNSTKVENDKPENITTTITITDYGNRWNSKNFDTSSSKSTNNRNVNNNKEEASDSIKFKSKEIEEKSNEINLPQLIKQNLPLSNENNKRTEEDSVSNTDDSNRINNSIFKNDTITNIELNSKNIPNYETNNKTDQLSNCNNYSNTDQDEKDLNTYVRKLSEAYQYNTQLKFENDQLHDELKNIRQEMEELQDQFRLDDADEFRQLQAELEIAVKNCRILQFKLRKVEKRCENLETEKIILQDKLDDYNRETNKIIDLEEELLIAKEVSIRLNAELEQALEWRDTSEILNKELKKQLDDLKELLDNQIKKKTGTEDYDQLVLVNNLYESTFREYFLQEQLYSLTRNSQSVNVTNQLRDLTDLLSSYQQKISILNEELDILKQQLVNRDKEVDQLKLQLKNLKRSRSSEVSANTRKQFSVNTNTSKTDSASTDMNSSSSSSSSAESSSTNTSNNNEEMSSETRKPRSMSFDASETLSKQVEIANDEIKLLRNKISRLEDDLLFVTQERDLLSSKIEKIESKAMESFSKVLENETECEVDNNLMKQINELKKKIDNLNVEAKQNDEAKNQLVFEIKQLKEQLDLKPLDEKSDSSNKKLNNEDIFDKKTDEKVSMKDTTDLYAIKNLTDADKLLRDENIALKSELDKRDETIAKLQADLQQYFSQIVENKKTIEIKDKKIDDMVVKDNLNSAKLHETENKLTDMKKLIADNDLSFNKLKQDLDFKVTIENELRTENKRLTTNLTDLNSQLKEKISDLDFLNKENNSLQERINADGAKMQKLEEDLKKMKNKLSETNSQLEVRNMEINQLKSKELNRDKNIFKENEKIRTELFTLQAKQTELLSKHDEAIKELQDELKRNVTEKEKLIEDMNELKSKQTNQRASRSLGSFIEQEIDHEKAVLQGIENQALNAKYETRIQYLEVEIDTLRSKIRKLLREKEIQDQVLKESQLLVKEIALKYATDSDAWNRQKQKLLEKEKLYEESVEMRKELKKAADKLRQKLQSLEEQIIEKQNKHTIEKNSWETQRIQYMSQNNKLEEQLSRLSNIKRSKKEIELAWDKERKELSIHIHNLENFIKDLQTQLAQRNTSLAQLNDVYGQNEKIQSLTGENEFLKNRIRELEIMLDEMEQVKRFLFEIKEAYETDKQDWVIAKEEFRNQLDLKENLWLDCNMRLNEIVNVIRAIQQNEPFPVNITSNKVDSTDDNSSITLNKNETLNNLVGSTSNILNTAFQQEQEQLQQQISQQHLLEQQNQLKSKIEPSKVNNIRKKLEPSQSEDLHKNYDDILLIDTTKDRKELDVEFDQTVKRINRVKDNMNTHRKFMDIVKSKSMKALNRKSSTTSLQINDHSFDSRDSSMPPSSIPTRAKSVSKEPSESSHKSNSGVFFSLSRRIAKIRFSSSSQPPPPIKSHVNGDDKQILEPQTLKVPQLQITRDQSPKKDMRERALSPGRLFGKLRARSPFSRASKADKADINAGNSSTITMLSKNKGFTVSVANLEETNTNKQLSHSQSLSNNDLRDSLMKNNNNLMNPLNNLRTLRATTATPTSVLEKEINMLSSPIDRNLRSMSCDYIDKQPNSRTGYLRKLNETLDENDELTDTSTNNLNTNSNNNNSNSSATISSTHNSLASKNSTHVQIENKYPSKIEKPQSQPDDKSAKKVNFTNSTSKVEALKKNFISIGNPTANGSSPSHVEVQVKSVKFKEPDEKLSKPDQTSPKQSNKESKLLKALDDALSHDSNESSTPDESKFNSLTKKNSKLKSSHSTQSVDKPPKVPLIGSSSLVSNIRNRFSSSKSRTIDFPDTNTNTISTSNDPQTESSSNSKLKTSASVTTSINSPVLTSNGKPIQSILRRSETPPATKGRQVSIESNDTTRETSIEKLLKSSTSTSRPLMFNN